MFINPEDMEFLIRLAVWIISLGLCLVLLFFRYFRNPRHIPALMVWANLGAGFLYAAHFPAAHVQEAWFETSDPGYVETSPEVPIRSIHIENINLLELAAYGCYNIRSENLCSFPVGALLETGAHDFIEVGVDPVIRYEVHHLERDCLQDDMLASGSGSVVIQPPYPIIPALGICVMGRPVDQIEARFDFISHPEMQAFPSRRPYIHNILQDRQTGQVIARFDGWYGATPYFMQDELHEPRRPDGVLGSILRIRGAGSGAYDREKVDQMMNSHGFNEDILRAAAQSEYQMYQASAIWLACRNEIRGTLSGESKKVLASLSSKVFPNEPNWTYPESCPDWAR
ncbi:hypothetical protein [Pseudosulfitobacter pseudonitzschiae]|uniref:hypothetical protein n=1 Tax=Pseudosulfitobacter pseudonitzschiae TaxID=1402135 RepID=UPI003B81484D